MTMGFKNSSMTDRLKQGSELGALQVAVNRLEDLISEQKRTNDLLTELLMKESA